MPLPTPLILTTVYVKEGTKWLKPRCRDRFDSAKVSAGGRAALLD